MVNSRTIELYEKVKSTIKQNSEKNEWTEYSIPVICSQYEMPSYMARTIVTCLRIDPEIRSKLLPSASRYKPKGFLYDSNIENKVKDSYNLDQFSFDQLELSILNESLKEYIKADTIKDYSIMMYICEKMISSKFHQNWGNPNVADISRLLMMSQSNIIDYIEILCNKKLMIQSPYTLQYKLTLKQSAYEEAEKEIVAQSADPELVAQGKLNSAVLSNDFTNLKTSEKFQSTVRRLQTARNQLSAAIASQLKMIDAMAMQDKDIERQKNTLSRLSKTCNELSEQIENKQQEVLNMKEELDLTNQTLSSYQEFVNERIMDLTSYISSSLETYFKLPTFKKNDPSVNNRVKMELLDSIISFQKEIKQYKKSNN